MMSSSTRWRSRKVSEEYHYHVVPLGDIKEHKVSASCWCQPTHDEEDNIWVHHAMDERESYEQGRKLH